MVKRTITITTILLILTMAVGLMVILNKPSFGADDDIASGTSGTCSWVIDENGVLTIRPTNGTEGTLASILPGFYPSWRTYAEQVTKVVVEPGVKAASGATSMFENMSNCTEMDLRNLDVSAVRSINFFFSKCSSMTSLPTTMFNGLPLTSTADTFRYCSGVTTLNVSGWDTSHVTNMNSMFNGCLNLTTLDVSNFNTSNVSDLPAGMAEMFANCSSLTTLDVSNFTCERTRSVAGMFNNCSSLTSLDCHNMTCASTLYFSNFVRGCTNLESLDISSMNTGACRQMMNDFANCPNLSAVKLSPDWTWYGTGSPLPTPTGAEFTGKWIREDKAFGPYTAEELIDNYDGSTMAGTWIRERKPVTVTYSYTGTIPEGASELPEARTYGAGENVTVAPDATAPGYTFSGWSRTGTFEMPAENIEITGYFIENPKSYNYKVEYYFDGELDESLEEILNAEKDEEISITPQTPLKHGGRNYTLASDKHKITISINEEENIIKVYYETDVLDYETDNSEDTTEGDGIPDKYQIMITYKVENGLWDDGTKGTKMDVITLKDKDGNYAEDGTGELTVPQVGNKPAEGYEMGSWNETIPKRVSSKDNGKEFVYSYKTISKADISRAKGNLSNPKTDDIMHNYLLVGVAGVLVLMVVRKIRRKYSRKAKKIQF